MGSLVQMNAQGFFCISEVGSWEKTYKLVYNFNWQK